MTIFLNAGRKALSLAVPHLVGGTAHWVAGKIGDRRRARVALGVFAGDAASVCRKLRSLNLERLYSTLADDPQTTMNRLAIDIGDGHFRVFDAFVSELVYLTERQSYEIIRFYRNCRTLQGAVSSTKLPGRTVLNAQAEARFLLSVVRSVLEMGDMIVTWSRNLRPEDCHPAC